MSPLTWEPTVCPCCASILEGLGRWCPSCNAYTSDLAASTTNTTPTPEPDSITITLPWACLASDNLRKALDRPRYAEYKAARDSAHHVAAGQIGTAAIKGDVAVSIAFYLPDKRRRDPNNLTKGICDALTGLAYNDDSQIRAMSWHVAGTDTDHPRAVITVEAM